MADKNFINKIKRCFMARGVWRFVCTLAGILLLLGLCQVKTLAKHGNKADLTEENRHISRNLLQDNVDKIRVSGLCFIYCRGNPLSFSMPMVFPFIQEPDYEIESPISY